MARTTNTQETFLTRQDRKGKNDLISPKLVFFNSKELVQFVSLVNYLDLTGRFVGYCFHNGK